MKHSFCPSLIWFYSAVRKTYLSNYLVITRFSDSNCFDISAKWTNVTLWTYLKVSFIYRNLRSWREDMWQNRLGCGLNADLFSGEFLASSE